MASGWMTYNLDLDPWKRNLTKSRNTSIRFFRKINDWVARLRTLKTGKDATTNAHWNPQN